MKQIKCEMKQEGLTMEVDREKFAMALKTWRIRSNKTQRQVAELWNVSRFTIMRAEAAKPLTWEMAYRLFARLSTELANE